MYRNYNGPFRASGQAIWASDRPRFSFQGSKYMARDGGMVIAGDEDYAAISARRQSVGIASCARPGSTIARTGVYQRHGNIDVLGATIRYFAGSNSIASPTV